MTVSDRLASRANGITLLRLGLAVLVVLGHAWEVGGFGPDPLQRTAGVSCGEMGVNAFFGLSGYLVTQSWLRSRSGWNYLWRRALRIFPGFWLFLFLGALGLCPALWARQHGTRWLDAFGQAPFLGYIGHNFLLRIRQPGIGDLFAAHPAAGVVDGSLWSLFPEFLCYLGVALAGLLGWFAPRRTPWLWLVGAITFAAHASGPTILSHLSGPIQGSAWYLWRLSTQASFFFTGALVCIHGSRLPAGWRPAGAILLLLGVATYAGAYAWTGPWLLPLLLLEIAALTSSAWLDRVGDYSYGIYVYHYPLQQTLVFFGLGASAVLTFFGLTCALVLPAAVVSWHLVEKPALRLKRYY